MKFYLFLIIINITTFISCKKDNLTIVNQNIDPIIEIETIISNYEIIWGMDFLPNGDLLFGEKRGKLYIKYSNSSKISEINGMPSVDTYGQGGGVGY